MQAHLHTFSALSVAASVTRSNWSAVRGILLVFFIPSLNFAGGKIIKKKVVSTQSCTMCVLSHLSYTITLKYGTTATQANIHTTLKP